MTEEHRETGVGWPDAPATTGPRDGSGPATGGPAGDAGHPAEPAATGPDAVDSDTTRPVTPVSTPAPEPGQPEPERPEPAGGAGEGRRPSAAGVAIGLLLALLGFAIAVQFRSVSTDPTLAAARQEDLVRILSDLQAREQRLRGDITELEESQRQLNSGVLGRQAALDEARRRADELGILAGTLPARGPGLHVRFAGPSGSVKARAVLDAVQELRGAGAEAMQIAGGDGAGVRIVASSYFVDADGGLNVDGRLITGPYTLRVIGDPETMRTALHIAGGVVESVAKDGGTVTDERMTVVEVTALHDPPAMEYAKPVS